MNAALILTAQQAARCSGGLLAALHRLYPDITPDILIIGDAVHPTLPDGCGTVFCIPGPELSECLDPWIHYSSIEQWASKGQYHLLLMSAGFSEDILAHSLAYSLGGSALCGVSRLTRLSDGSLAVFRGVCCQEMDGAFSLVGRPWVLTLHPEIQDTVLFPQPSEYLSPPQSRTDWFSGFTSTSISQDNLTSSPIVLIGGRGAGPEGLAKLYELARRLGALVGVTRPMVFEGIAPISQLVGTSAAVLSPPCCLVFGASGSAAFTAGIERSGTLIGVNLDQNAPLFEFCDFGIVEDCVPLLDALLTLTEEGASP